MTLKDVLKRIDKQGGFLTTAELTALVAADKMRMVLVRCNNGRFLCPAQNVAWFSDLLTSTGKEWVRDVSLPTSDPIYSGDYETRVTVDPPFGPERPDKTAKLKAWTAMAPAVSPPHFNESDCSGAFDGFTVTSDADPGL